jgi:hypothetical protein
VDDLHFVAVVKNGESRFEPALPEVAPRTDEIGPDIDTHTTSIAAP